MIDVPERSLARAVAPRAVRGARLARAAAAIGVVGLCVAAAGRSGVATGTWTQIASTAGATPRAMCWSGGRMWVATSGALLECTGDGCVEHTEQKDIGTIAGDSQGRLWAAPYSLDPLWLCDNGEWRRNTGGVTYIMSKAVAESACYDTNLVRPELPVDHGVPWLPPAGVGKLVVDAHDNLWGLPDRGFPAPSAFEFDGERLRCWNDEAAQPLYFPTDIAAVPGSGIWISCLAGKYGEAGEFPYDPSRGSSIRVFDGQWRRETPAPPLMQMAVDGTGTVWGLGGVYWEGKTTWVVYRSANGEWLPSFQTQAQGWALAADPGEGAWVVVGGPWQVVHVTEEGVQAYAYPYERSHRDGGATIAVDSQARPWVGDDLALFRLEENTAVQAATWGHVKRRR